MSKRMNNNNNTQLPSPASPDKKNIYFTIERGRLIKIIILIFLLLFVLGCTAKSKGTKTVSCSNSFNNAHGWVSAESNNNFWVVNENGKVMEFEKSDCSIKG